MSRRKDTEIYTYKLKSGKTKYGFKTYIGINQENGKAVKVTRQGFKSRKEAEAAKIQIKAKGADKVAKSRRQEKTVQQVYEAWIDSLRLSVRGSTLHLLMGVWKDDLQAEFGSDYINHISPDHIQRYADNVAERYVTYKKMTSELHRIIKYAIFRHWADHDPFDFVIVPKKSAKKSRDNSKNFYERAELVRFLSIVKAYDSMKYAYFMTVASLGCRRGEGLALTWSDIDFKNRAVTISKTVARDRNGYKTIDPVKNGLTHTVPMSNNLYEVLKEYKQQCEEKGQTSDLLFPQHNGTIQWGQQVDLWLKGIYHFDAKQVKKWNKKHPDKPKKKPLRHITPHGLRHTLATLLYEGSANIRPKDVQYLLGHRSVKTALQIYTHVTKKQKKDIKDSINKLDL